MKYISLDISTLNNIDSTTDLISVAMLFCDTDNEKKEYLEFSVIHDEYLVKHSEMQKATKELQNILKTERISCYFENLVSYIDLHLNENGIPQSDEISIITNNIDSRIKILGDLFCNYKIDLFSIPRKNINDDLSHVQICELQRDYFEKIYQISK